jgi:Holliday junction resolvase RusA-like endonuclease
MKMTEAGYAAAKARNVARTRSAQAKPGPAAEPEQHDRASYSFSVPGVPVAKGRPRLGKGGHVYTPAKTRDAERAIASCAQLAGVKPLRGAVKVSLRFYLSRPKSAKNDDPMTKPDLDNLAKTVLDALPWEHGDQQCICLFLNKWYDHVPRTEVQITEL